MVNSDSHSPGDFMPEALARKVGQGAGLPAPAYRQIAREGPDHAPVFTVTVLIDGHEPLPGIGSSKQLAEREAARAMLTAIGGPA